MQSEPQVSIEHGYGGKIKIEALIDDVRYVIEKDHLTALLEDLIMKHGYTTYKKKHQVIPRIEICQK